MVCEGLQCRPVQESTEARGECRLRPVRKEKRMFRIWYWAAIDRESDGRFIASIPDLDDLAAQGANEKEAVAHLTELAGAHVRGLVDAGQPAPHARRAAEL